MNRISIFHNGIHLEFCVTQSGQLKFLHFSPNPLNESDLLTQKEADPWGPDFLTQGWPLVQVQVSGYNRPYERQGNKHLVTAPGYALRYVSHRDEENELGRLLTFVQEDDETGLRVTSWMQFYGDLPVVRCASRVENRGEEVQTLEYVSSFFYQGVEKESTLPTDEKMSLLIPHNSWMKEMNRKRYTFPDLGLQSSQPTLYAPRTSKSFCIQNTGHWSTKEFLPMGYLANSGANSALFWQIEHNGSWLAELSDYNGHFCLGLSGPTELQSHWSKDLQPGDSFTTVPVAVGTVENSFDAAMAALTRYRRLIRRPNADDENLPVIFNDYMNCLFGDPTTEKELPLIDAAAAAGCEYYVIDAGWYSPGFWWDSVGEWKESRERFRRQAALPGLRPSLPDGLRALTDYIRSKGMVPGVWLELESMGIHCPLAAQVPDDWFFLRHGKKVYDRSRYQLDFRNPQVIDHVNEVVRRVVEDYGVGYIKMDYNIEPGIGTEVRADSVGDGLLQHERAYLRWLEGVFDRYPGLVIENCSSGGLRMDYAMLSRYSIQSTSDMEDYRMYATIAANAPAAVTPEQAAVWSYPMRGGDVEETVFNMVNALLLRVHQSGHLAELSPERLAYVHQGIAWYKSIRSHLKNAVPFWPLGLSDYRDVWSALALEDGTVGYLALWRRGGDESRLTVPLPRWAGRAAQVACAYPAGACAFRWDEAAGRLTVDFPAPVMARIFAFEMKPQV
ncbi:MAG: alpha-galactosidase [Clostridiales bacterium]|nr:alpha-galactosidase [Clostridiales bacterium]